VNTRLKLLNLRCCKLDTAVATHTTAGLELYLSENHELAGDREAVGCANERMLRVNTRLKESNISAVDLTLQ